MSIELEKQEAGRLLLGLENGTMSSADAFNIADKRDPVLVYFVIRYLREKYPPTDPQSQGVIQRLVELTGTYDSIVKACKEGEADPMQEWFDDTYSMRDFFSDADNFVDVVVEKLEG
jgi:hypothetical protein